MQGWNSQKHISAILITLTTTYSIKNKMSFSTASHMMHTRSISKALSFRRTSPIRKSINSIQALEERIIVIGIGGSAISGR